MQILGQRDPRWAADKLGGSSLTVGRFGCTTTAIAMLSDYFKSFKNPGQIAHNVNNYTPGGLILWNNLNTQFEHMKFVWRDYHRDDAKIQDALRDPDKAVILQVNHGAHWVTGIRKTLFGGSYIVADPLFGDKCDAIERYGNITGAAFFASK